MATKDTIDEIKARFRRKAQNEVLEPLTKGAKGALIGHLNGLAGSDAMRRMILFVWFREQEGDDLDGLSTKELTEGEWAAVQDVADPFEYEGTWMVTGTFSRMVEQTKAYIVFSIT